MNVNEITMGNLDNYTEYAQEWLTDMWESFKEAEQSNPKLNGAVVCPQYTLVVIADDTVNPVAGVATCADGDEWNTAVGVAIAYARAIDEEIPDEVLNWADYEDEDEWYDEDETDYDEGEALTVADLDGGDKVIIDNMVYIACEINPITREVTMYNLSTNEREYLDGDTEVDRILD